MSYVSFLDIWMLICMLFVFSCILEFIIVTVLLRSGRKGQGDKVSIPLEKLLKMISSFSSLNSFLRYLYQSPLFSSMFATGPHYWLVTLMKLKFIDDIKHGQQNLHTGALFSLMLFILEKKCSNQYPKRRTITILAYL